MRNRSITASLIAAGLTVALVGPADLPEPGTADPGLADTLSVDRLSQVTMEPIRVVVPIEAWLDSVTMEPIRVVIPRPGSASPDTRESPRR
jgi:hypothetical protein